MKISEQIEKIPVETVGKALVATGAGGMSIQVITQWTSLFASIASLCCALLGIYIGWRKLRNEKGAK